MRDISTLTPREGAGLWDAVMPSGKPFRGSATHFPADENTPERVCFMSGVERLGVQFDGKVWADSDMQPIELDQDKVREYFSGIGISLPLAALKTNVNAPDFLSVLEENYQAHIAGYYNMDKTEEDRKIRSAIIQDYKDLIAIYKNLTKK